MSSDSPPAVQRLKGRRILITGAASGIGKSTAELFKEEGAALALIDRNADRLEAVSRQVGAAPIVLDLENSQAIAAAVETAATAMGGLDGIVNCAAIGANSSIDKTDLALLSKFVAINLMAPYLICRTAMPHLRNSTVATIVNVASGQALLPNSPNSTAYAATKGGLVSFSKSLAAEAAPHVRVNAVCPGVTNTPFAAPLLAAYPNPSDAPWVKQYALKRVAEPSEIARAVLFLSCGESSFVTGVALAVDGGRTFH
jgi:NAD(P)-dependent dehydrogenase (short-subunit alcohol dehydrogenase family)